jgi:hypothetical protein
MTIRILQGCPMRDGSNSKAPSSDRKNPFEAAAEMVERYKGWINWNDAKEVISKPIASAVALLTAFKLQELVPDLFEHLSACIEDGNFVHDYANFYQHNTELRSTVIRDLSKFILQAEIQKEVIRLAQHKYYATQIAISLIDFLLIHKPCCRLVQTAWLFRRSPPVFPQSPSSLTRQSNWQISSMTRLIGLSSIAPRSETAGYIGSVFISCINATRNPSHPIRASSASCHWCRFHRPAASRAVKQPAAPILQTPTEP